jgi:hypothetical protein
MVRIPFFSSWVAVEPRVVDVEHIRYELITFLIASRETVSAQT